MNKLKSLKIYELFAGEKNQDYYAIHTLIQLFNSDKEYLKSYHIKNLDKTLDKINNIRNHFSEFSISPYLILKNLNGNEKNILDKLVYEIFPNFTWDDNPTNEINKINPPKNEKFIKNLLYAIKSDGNNYSKEFRDPSKAEELFCFYADKNHIPLLVKDLKSISRAYNQSCNAHDSLDD